MSSDNNIKNKIQKTSKKFYCEICDYTSSRKNDFKNHRATIKHKQRAIIKNENVSDLLKNENSKINSNLLCKFCNRNTSKAKFCNECEDNNKLPKLKLERKDNTRYISNNQIRVWLNKRLMCEHKKRPENCDICDISICNSIISKTDLTKCGICNVNIKFGRACDDCKLINKLPEQKNRENKKYVDDNGNIVISCGKKLKCEHNNNPTLCKDKYCCMIREYKLCKNPHLISKFLSYLILRFNVKNGNKKKWILPNTKFTWYEENYPKFAYAVTKFDEYTWLKLLERFNSRTRRNRNFKENELINELKIVYDEYGIEGLTANNLDKNKSIYLYSFILKYQTPDDASKNKNDIKTKQGIPMYYACRVLNILKEREQYCKTISVFECNFEEMCELHIKDKIQTLFEKYGIITAKIFNINNMCSIVRRLQELNKNVNDINTYFNLPNKLNGLDGKVYDSKSEVYFYNFLHLRNIPYRKKIYYKESEKFISWWNTECPKELKDEYLKTVKSKDKIPKFETDGSFYSPIHEKYINVEIWMYEDDDIKNCMNYERYLLTKKIKKKYWNSSKDEFLEIKWDNCHNETLMYNILINYIGICVPKFSKYDFNVQENEVEILKKQLQVIVRNNNDKFPDKFMDKHPKTFNYACRIFGKKEGSIVNRCKLLIGIIDVLPDKPRKAHTIQEKIEFLKKGMEIEDTSVYNFSQDYQIPNNKIYPELEGTPLGQFQSSIRLHNFENDTNCKEIIKHLNDINFVWNDNDYNFKLLYKGLEIFKSKYGHLQVNQKYIIDINNYSKEQLETIPSIYWNDLNGFTLGLRVSNLRSGFYINEDKDNKSLIENMLYLNKYGVNIHTIQERKKIIDDLGFVYDTKKYEFIIIYDALCWYKNVKDNLLIPQNGKKQFINRINFKENELNQLKNKDYYINYNNGQGYPLGRKINSIKSKKSYIKDNKKNEDMLIEIGFPF